LGALGETGKGSGAGRDALRAWKRAVLEEREILRRVAPQNDRKEREKRLERLERLERWER